MMERNNIGHFMLIFVTIMLIGTTNLFAVDDNTKLMCPTESRPDTGDYGKMWECPSLPNYGASPYDLKHHLTNIDYTNGRYTCGYAYPDTNKYVQSCSFLSQTYVKMKQTIHDTMYGKQVNNTSTIGKFELLKKAVSGSSTVSVKNTGASIDFNADFNLVGVSAPSFITSVIQPRVNSLISTLQDSLLKAEDKTTALYKVETNLDNLKNFSYKHLVEPYYVPSARDTLNKEYTFSNFLAGLVTLNDTMVTGYNEGTGELIIDPTWKAQAFSVSPTQKDMFTSIASSVVNGGKSFLSFLGFYDPTPEDLDAQAKTNNVLDTMDGGADYDVRISSWLDIFEMKIWGFYYNFQRRFDLGYNVISTQLLYIMSMWFILMVGTKTGVGHVINREQGVKVTEENWMKGLGMMVGIGLFFISLSSPITSQNIEGSETITQEMSKNKTIAKYVIRESANMGANFGTMLSDLGLDAFLSFVVKKQNLMSVRSVVSTFQASLIDMEMYYPAYQTVTVCRQQYGLTDADFLNATKIPSPVSEWDTSYSSVPFMSNNNISYIGYGLCQKAYKISAMMPKDITFAIAEAEERINNVDNVTAKAMYLLAVNQIAMQDKLGWVNTFSVPVSYFMMKHNDMFLSKGIDYEEVEKKSAEMSESMNLKDGGDVSTDDADGLLDKAGLLWNRGSDTLQKFSGYVFAKAGTLMMYNILPAFGEIRGSLYDWMNNVHEAKLEIALADNKGSFAAAKEFLKSTLGKLVRSSTPIGWLYKLINSLTSVKNVIAWKTVITILSFAIALAIWKSVFTIMFIATISILVLLKTVLYFKDLIIHFIASIFIVVWAFTKQGGQGEGKMATFLRDTLILMIYPSLIVLASYVFIFIYEFFSTVYTYLMSLMLEGQKANVSLMTVANSGSSTFTAYMNIYSLSEFSQIMVMAFGLIIAVVTILQLPEYVLKKLGINENETMMMSSGTEKISGKGEKFTNPL